MLSDQQASSIREFASLVTPSGTFSIIGFTGQQVAALNDLARIGYVADCGSEHFRLTPSAFTALTDYDQQQTLLQQAAERRAEEKRDQAVKDHLEDKRYRKDARRSWLQLFITIFFNIVCVFIGAVLEHQTHFLDWFTSLFH